MERRADHSDCRVSKIHVTGRVRDYMRNQRPYLERHPLAEARRAATVRSAGLSLEEIKQFLCGHLEDFVNRRMPDAALKNLSAEVQ